MLTDICCDSENVYLCGYVKAADTNGGNFFIGCFSKSGELECIKVYRVSEKSRAEIKDLL